MKKVVIILLIVLFFNNVNAQNTRQYWWLLNQTMGCGTCSSNQLLNTYSGAVAAYSFRKLDKNYSGYCITITKAGADSLNVGFCGCYVDTAAIKTYAGSSNIYLKNWYDQTGNGYTMSIPNPTIKLFISGSFLYIGNTISAVDSSVFTMQSSSAFTFSSAFTVAKVDTVTTINYIAGRNTPTGNGLFYNGTFGGVNGLGGADGTNVRSITGKDLNRHLGYFNMTGGNLYVAKDGAAATNTGTFGASLGANTIFGRPGNDGGIVTRGKIQELIFYTSEQSANKSGIESNINSFYSIY